jgi:threonyl-tRNA synthetase
VRLLPVTDAHQEYCQKTRAKLLKAGIRCEIDRGSDRLAKQIRNAEKARIPIICIIGEREVENNSVNVRLHGEIELGEFDVAVLTKRIRAASDAAVEFLQVDESTIDV